MNEVLVVLGIAYIFLAALLLLALVYGSMSWVTKLVLILVSVGFYWVSYLGWQNAQGWPSQADLPKRFLFYAVVVEEPDKTEGIEGRLFVWASDLANDRPSDTPRAYVLPYDKELHVKLDAAQRQMRNGNLQIGEVGGELFDPQATRDNTRIADKKIDLEFTDLPDPQLPEK
ncbi:MAG: hypothetical protein ACT4NK_12565 [Limnobacter sp.]|jgi:hypothetical protein|uniref:hypothetical protein n=1 Tax=Limnobacter TaxID=131079 RepID=UPI000C512239|nr:MULTISPECIES: hypothetical protein [unclassified Limnobacter]MAG82063.1 hypothetical protein [Sutterellaceae bacterium]MBA4316019.1 hypothetical protein [Alcaligenaceae bacterium]MBT85585.1 hypothetical protein [Sutterellaceae bacterium]HAV75508.1 hypothetical protein [Limnobacter sp.]|tara:strand:+ start:1269 stop:1784 length:516 start_codon:yes stop_codon:yes gene_type:complete